MLRSKGRGRVAGHLRPAAGPHRRRLHRGEHPPRDQDFHDVRHRRCFDLSSFERESIAWSGTLLLPRASSRNASVERKRARRWPSTACCWPSSPSSASWRSPSSGPRFPRCSPPSLLRSKFLRKGEHSMVRYVTAAKSFIAKCFGRKEEGASLAEYGLLLALIAVVCIVAITLLWTKISTMFATVAASI